VVKHHVESEEKTLFDIAQDYFNDEEISKIAQEFDRVEADLYKRSTIEPLTRS
jgi:hemerythrin-like domain-containing protein